ncbi:Flagellar basal-body rod protein FlgC [hydrothermal vent metagenome]|uniref:Flagellar basal-body rod protein FlgC n=1 Tax=hydrothermal vent metagenome TaxID=652676 RepID=A0A3B1CEE0_9ZZZZ
MDLFSALKISSSGMSAQRTRLNVVSSNLANINTTKTPEGGPYKRKSVVVQAVSLNKPGTFANAVDNAIRGVKVTQIKEDNSAPRMLYDPSHPDADENGYVAMPNVNMMEEMVDMLSASRAYEANAMAANTAKQMAQKAIEMGQR